MTNGDTSLRAARTGRQILIGAVLVIVAWLVVAGLGGQSFGKLSGLQKNDNASYLPGSSESAEVAAEVAKVTDSTTLPMMIVGTSSGALTQAELAQAQAFAASLPQMPIEVADEVHTLTDYLTSDEVAAVPSQDGQAILIVLPLNADTVSEAIGETTPLEVIGERVRMAVASQLTDQGWTAYVTGPAGFITDLVNAFAGIDGILLYVALGVVLVILLFVYRSPVLPFAVLFTAAFALTAAVLVVYLIADQGWITVTGQSQGILSILVVGASTDYALLLVSRYKEELHDQDNAWQALRIAWRATVEPILASGITVILGLLALMLAELKGTSGLGPVGALGIAGALLAALTLLPAFLLLGRRWIFWPSIPRVDHAHRADVIDTGRGWGKVARFVARRPRQVWVTTVVILLGAAAFLPTLKADGVSQSDLFTTTVDSVTGQEVLAAHFDAGSGSPVQVIVPQEHAQEALDVLSSQPSITAAYAGLTPGGPPTSINGISLLQGTLSVGADTPEASDAVASLRASLAQAQTGAKVGGQSATNLDVRDAAGRDFVVVAPAIILVVFIVLVLLLRAVVAPLVLVAANILSFAATIGISALMFNHVFDFPGGDPTTILYGFVFLVALGVDYSIFLMTRAREEVARHGPHRGVLLALAVTGGVITSAGVVLAATFGALVVIPLIFLAQIAFIVAFGVLLDTLVVRSLLVPAVTIDLGRWAWWPSTLFRSPSTDDDSLMAD
ncbi:MAG: MMPL family transporter [Nostocoides sp.]